MFIESCTRNTDMHYDTDNYGRQKEHALYLADYRYNGKLHNAAERIQIKYNLQSENKTDIRKLWKRQDKMQLQRTLLKCCIFYMHFQYRFLMS